MVNFVLRGVEILGDFLVLLEDTAAEADDLAHRIVDGEDDAPAVEII